MWIVFKVGWVKADGSGMAECASEARPKAFDGVEKRRGEGNWFWQQSIFKYIHIYTQAFRLCICVYGPYCSVLTMWVTSLGNNTVICGRATAATTDHLRNRIVSCHYGLPAVAYGSHRRREPSLKAANISHESSEPIHLSKPRLRWLLAREQRLHTALCVSAVSNFLLLLQPGGEEGGKKGSLKRYAVSDSFFCLNASWQQQEKKVRL